VPKDPLQPNRCAAILAALAAPERLQIIRFLRDGPRNVTEIAAMLKTAPVNVAHHTRVLKGAGLVRPRKRGRFVFYSLAPGVLQAVDAAGGLDQLDLGCCRLEVPLTVRGKPPAPPA
jgi:DNA-binding transcriptional ArsR family regulator